MEIEVPPGATVVALDRQEVLTPVGRFRVFQAGEQRVSFYDPTNQLLKVDGYIDRLHGEVNSTLAWPEGEAVRQAKLARSSR